MPKYIHEYHGYPKFTWDKDALLNLLTRVSALQGKILGKMQQFGFGVQQEAMLSALTEEITKSSEIEGEILNSEQVRSSLAKRLNINLEKGATPSHHIEGIVEAVMDAALNYKKPLDEERLFGWHGVLFPTGRSGLHKIRVAKFRDSEISIISNKEYQETIHYEAPLPEKIQEQMAEFLLWLNAEGNEIPLLKAAIAHLWFVIIHPFDDGNGRLTRIITEMMLARSEGTSLRFYSMSAQIQKEKKEYYRVLELTTTGELDITAWLIWFLECLGRAIEASEEIIGKVLRKAVFWQKNSAEIPNKMQREIMNRLLDGFTGNLTSGKVEKIFKVSQPTAIRMLSDLVKKGFLEVRGAGRGTHYQIPQIISLGECESTHKYVRENLASLQEWTVVTAEYQISGHGRHGRAWVAPKGKNLCFNVVLPTKNLKPEFYAPTAQIAAITIAKMLKEKGIDANVKWPNDVLVNKRKICGIISELLGAHISIGVGINVNTEKSDFTGLDRPATSIFMETGKTWDKKALLQEFLGKFKANFEILCKSGLQSFIEDWRKMGCFAGHKARLVDGNSVLDGVIEAIKDDGSLLFRTETGLKTVWSGDLEI
jgi:biotin-[acetyl-CoA-carboxylase] ligase BirA-like protein